MLFLIYTLDFIGTILIAVAALSVHHRVLNEHEVDAKVFRTMKFEQKLGIFGVLCVIAAYILKLTT